jgi:hypothetical protein
MLARDAHRGQVPGLAPAIPADAYCAASIPTGYLHELSQTTRKTGYLVTWRPHREDRRVKTTSLTGHHEEPQQPTRPLASQPHGTFDSTFTWTETRSGGSDRGSARAA